ncbi:MAG: CopG family transcriptional regulator [Alphaproteobacteria bacterium]|nr:CopG family transcriptional regulator [Alphaproteobacteria bacterium]
MGKRSKNVRTSVILDDTQHGKLLAVAARNDVSAAWVIRHAIGRFLDEYEDQGELPLVFGKEKVRESA